MGKTQYYCASSLDGYIASPDDTIDWLLGYRGHYGGEDAIPNEGEYERFYDGVGALVMGSVTYEYILGEMARGAAWPPGGEWPYGGRRTLVLTSRQLSVPSGHEGEIELTAEPVASAHAAASAAAGERNVWLMGGGNVAAQFAAEGLLDELLVTLVPVVLGAGKPLFEGPVGPMQLTAARPFDSGMVELRYELDRAT